MHAAKSDLPVGMEIPNIITSRQAQWGDLNVAVENIAIGDATKFFAAKLPEGRCQCPHWGYVVKGTATFTDTQVNDYMKISIFMRNPARVAAGQNRSPVRSR